jgi:hypothetical protein
VTRLPEDGADTAPRQTKRRDVMELSNAITKLLQELPSFPMPLLSSKTKSSQTSHRPRHHRQHHSHFNYYPRPHPHCRRRNIIVVIISASLVTVIIATNAIVLINIVVPVDESRHLHHSKTMIFSTKSSPLSVFS